MASLDSIVPWSQVNVLAQRILILGFGPSLRQVERQKIIDAYHQGVFILAVNRSIGWAPFAPGWFTLDPNKYVYPIMKEAVPGRVCYVAVPNDYGRPSARIHYHRVEVPSGINYLRRIPGDGPLKSKYTLSEHTGKIHTGNSVWGALGVSYLMMPEKIVILGLDGTQGEYAYGRGKPLGDLSHLPELFASAGPQLRLREIEVLNGSPNSSVTCFPRVSPNEAMDWLMDSAGDQVNGKQVVGWD